MKIQQNKILQAILSDNRDILKVLLNQKNVNNLIGDWSYLDFAVYHNRPEIIRFLIALGININHKDDFGENAMFKAVSNLHPYMVELLTKYKIQNTKNIHDFTALDIAELRKRHSKSQNETEQLTKIISILKENNK